MQSPASSRSRPTETSSDTSNILYRGKELLNRGIRFRTAPFTTDGLPDEIKAPLKLCCSLDSMTTFEDILDQQPFEDTIQVVSEARSILAKVELCLRNPGDEPEWALYLWSKVYEPFHKDGEFCVRSNKNWDANLSTTSFKVAGLPRPKPDLAFGFTVSGGVSNESPRQQEMLSDEVLGFFERHPDIDLHPRPSPQNDWRLAYPGLIHEIKSSSGVPEFVENQLARSLSFAVDQQVELRDVVMGLDTTSSERKERCILPIFGITSLGHTMYFHHTVVRNDNELDIVRYEVLSLDQPRHACAVVLFIRSLKYWLKTVYKPHLLEMLTFLHLQYSSPRQAVRASMEAELSPDRSR